MKKSALVPVERIEDRIFLIRGHKVVLDTDLAALYGTTTKRLNEQVRRNRERFPSDFMFQLMGQELAALRSQIATSNRRPGRGGRRYLPFAFTEHGAIQAANVLSSPRAVEMGIYVVRAFIRMREVLSTHRELARKLAALERRIDAQDETIVEILAAIRQLMAPPEPRKKRPIGFIIPAEK